MTTGDTLATWFAEQGEGTISTARRKAGWLRHTHDLPARPQDSGRWMRDVSSLGYIEMQWDLDRWTAAPLVITRLPHSDGLALITGRVTAEVRHQVTNLSAEAEVHYCSQPTSPNELDRPRSVLVQYETISELHQAAKQIGAQYVPCAATQIAAQLVPPTLGTIAAPPRDSNDTLEIFDPTDRTWKLVNQLEPRSAGLHRFDVHNRKRHLWFGSQDWQQCDLAAGIHIALSECERSSLQWRPRDGGATGEVICDIGAPLPVLYQRALVLCSGLLPTFSKSARTAVYSNIPIDVARTVARNLRQSLDPV